MAAMDNRHRQRPQPVHRLDVIGDVGMSELVDELPVIDGVCQQPNLPATMQQSGSKPD